MLNVKEFTCSLSKSFFGPVKDLKPIFLFSLPTSETATQAFTLESNNLFALTSTLKQHPFSREKIISSSSRIQHIESNIHLFSEEQSVTTILSRRHLGPYCFILILEMFPISESALII